MADGTGLVRSHLDQVQETTDLRAPPVEVTRRSIREGVSRPLEQNTATLAGLDVELHRLGLQLGRLTAADPHVDRFVQYAALVLTIPLAAVR